MFSRDERLFGRAIITLIGLLFFAPYAVTLILAKGRLSLPSDFLELLSRSVLQAAVSGAMATLCGLFAAGLLLRLSHKKSALWEGLALFPAIVPSGIVVLGLMDLAPDWRGLWAIAAAHTLISSGFVGVILARLIRDRLGASLELAWIEGASRSLMWRRGVLPKLKPELFRTWLTIFASSLGSFSVPLLLGGSQAYTFEIAIHHAIRLQGNWGAAAGLSVFQLLILVGFLLVFQRVGNDQVTVLARAHESTSRHGVARILGFSWGFPFFVLGPFVCLFSLVRDPILGWEQLRATGLLEHSDVLFMALQGSISTAALSGLLTAGVLLLAATSLPTANQRKWFNSYIAPSVAITGFATLVIGWGALPSFTWDVLRISLGAALLFSPLLWRLRWDEELGRLESAIAVARTLGANSALIISRILFPRLLPTALWSGGLVGFWMWGDYAVGSVVASRSMTMGMLAKSLMESYRLEASALILISTLIFGALTYRLFTWGGANVRR